MNIRFKISKKYNHFFFVQTLADWHFSCRQDYINSWLEDTGDHLTKEEKGALTAFKRLIQRYGFNNLEQSRAANAFDYFMRFDEFKQESVFNNEEVKVYLVAMDTLKPRFEKLWLKQKGGLDRISRLLETSFGQKEGLISDELKTIFDTGIDAKRSIEVILLLSAYDGGSGAGGANNGPNIVTLECSATKHEDLGYLLSTLWHEIIHQTMSSFIGETAKKLDANKAITEAAKQASKMDFEYSKELIVYSIFSPISYFTRKYFDTNISKQLHKSVESNNIASLLESRFVFIAYLIYLNGQFFESKLKHKQTIESDQLANAFIENHQLVKSFFLKNNKTPLWFSYKH